MENTTEQVCKRKFRHLNNAELVARINAAPDFGYDDESTELHRRIQASSGALEVKMNYNTLVIIKNNQ